MHEKIMGLLCGMVFALSASTAHAVATYDAAASFELTLTGVTDSLGNKVGADWSVEFEGFNDLEDSFEIGLAAASTLTDIAPFVSLGVDDTVLQSSSVSGSATDGVAASIAFTFFEIFVENNSTEVLTFEFDYGSFVDAAVSGIPGDGEDAFALAEVDVLDDLGVVDVLIFAEADLLLGPDSDSDSDESDFSFSLQPGESNFIEGFVDTLGFASTVPEPATLFLTGLGLAGIGYRRHRSRIAA